MQATATAAVQRQPVKVSTISILEAMPREQERDDFEVLVRVEAPEAEGVEKFAPIDLVAVLDVSATKKFVPDSRIPDKGKGEQSKMDLLKATMTFVVQMLRHDDRLAIVEFNNKVKRTKNLSEISDGGRTSLLQYVNQLELKGRTAFQPGLEKAVKILDERTTNGDRKRVGVIVFLSDGKENSGTIPKIDWDKVSTDPDDSLRRTLSKYPVHTFGFSKFHDSKALHLIAKFSYGTYSFINQDLGKIKDALAVFLGGLQTVVAVDAIINLRPDAVREVKITSIDSGGYKSHVNGGGESGDIRIPILYAAEKKNFIVHLRVPAAIPATGEQQLLITVTADGLCQDASAKSISIEPEVLSIRRPDYVVADKDSRRNEDVLQQMARFKVLGLLAEFQESYKGLKNVAELKRQHEAGAWLKHEWDELKKGAQLDLGCFEKDVKELVRNLKNGLGVAYIYSWESSHQMECATTMGSPEKVADAYKTPAIEMMAQMAQQPEERPRTCVQFDMIEQHLSCWSNFKCDLLLMPEYMEGTGGHHHLTTIPDLSLGSVNRAMYQSVCLAVEQASHLRRCYRAAKGHLRGDERDAPGADPCKCVDFDRIDQRLDLWSRVKREAPRLFQPSEDAEPHNRTRDASLEVINRAMHHDMYLAVVHASNLRRCNCAAKQPQEQAQEHGSNEAPPA